MVHIRNGENSLMAAVVVDPTAAQRLTLRAVEQPTPHHDEVLVRVAAISLNRGEVDGAMHAEAGARPGWDFAGTVTQAAADGTGPALGARVVGLMPTGAWAEFVAVPTNLVATLPDAVTFAQAATLPVAGLTALYAVEKATGIIGRTALVTGASGGVGYFATRLAHLAGAFVVGTVRQEQHADLVRTAHADHVVVGDSIDAAREFGPYRLIVDGVGGQTLSTALTMLAHSGTAVMYGSTTGADIAFNIWSVAGVGRTSIQGLTLFNELGNAPANEGLDRLARLVAAGKLNAHIALEAPWTEIGAVARQLLDRGYPGKAVLHIGN